jgi:cell division protein FtsI/penicillin-binding protein 2
MTEGLLAEYPPGSPFKILTGLIALQEGVITDSTHFYCRRGFSYARGRFMRCHCSGGLSTITQSHLSILQHLFFTIIYKNNKQI